MTITVTTTHAVEGRKIAGYLGIVTGEAVMGTNFVSDWFAGIRDVLGGRSGSYQKLLNRAKDQAVAVQDRDTQHDERSTARGLGPAAETRAEHAAGEHPAGRHAEGGEAGRRGDQPDVDLEEGKRHADHHRIDAGAEGGADEHERRAGARCAAIAGTAQRAEDHAPADEPEKAERHPVIDRRDVARGENPRRPADDRRRRLDEAEHHTGTQGVAKMDAAAGRAARQ